MTGRSLKGSFFAALMASAAPLWGQPSAQPAAEAQQSGVEDIVVTARRVGEQLQTTPVTVSVLTDEDLASRLVSDISEISRTTPNFTLEGAARSSGGGFNASVFMRGVGQDEFLITFEPGVGLYLDGVYLGRTVGGVLELSDVERVEVIKGPQGTLFGRNTIGGVVQIVSKPPADEFEGSVRLGVRTDDGYEGEAMLNAPLSEKALFRVSGLYRTQDGYSRNLVTGEDLGDVDRLVGRAQLRLLPTETLTIDLSADGSRARQNGIPTTLLDYAPFANGQPTLAALYNIFNFGSPCVAPGCPAAAIDATDVRIGARDTSILDAPSVNDADLWGFAGTATWEASDALTIKSITAYRGMKALFTGDLDGTDAPLVNQTYRTRQRQFSQELQFAGSLFEERLTYVAGLYYFREKARESGDIQIFRTLFPILEAAPGPFIPLLATVNCMTMPQFCAGGAGNPNNQFFDLYFGIASRINSRSLAAYGQFDFAVTDRLRLTAGLRYTKDRKRFTYSAERLGGSGALYGQNGVLFSIAPSTQTGEYDAWTPKFGIDFEASDDLFLYASAARGFKSGGFNGRATSVADFSAFEPETIWSFEVGFKSDLLDNRLRLNGAAFYSDYKNIQTTVAITLPNGTTASPVLNAGAAEIYGAELELVAKPVDQLTLTGGIGLLHARYTEDTPPSIVEGNSLPKAPDVQLSFAADYRAPLSDSIDLGLGGDVSYRSRQENEPSNYRPVSQEGYALINLRASLSDPDDRWQLSAFVKNLTDEVYLANSFRSGGGTNVGYYARGREFGSSLSFRF